MLTAVTKAKHPLYRWITWCMVYIFFFQTLSQTALLYVDTTSGPTPAQQAGPSMLDSLIGFFVAEAEAADTVKSTTLTPEQSAASGGIYTASSTGGASGSGTGTAGGEGGVNSIMGAFAYSYPLQVPPGRGGLAPSLALNYSSFNGNGWLGTGWSLSVGSIERSTKDGAPAYNDDDTFVITIKGTAITLVRETGEYRLKDEGLFLRVLKNGDVWTATDKDGTRYTFGANGNSRQYHPSAGIFKWCLTSIEDANGNIIDFTYDTDDANNQIYLQKIAYDANNFIVFESEQARMDAPASYATYFLTRTMRRLQHIRVYHGGEAGNNLVRRYLLTYEDNNSTHQSFLKSLTLYGKDGGALPPVDMAYVTTTDYRNSAFSEASSGTWPSWGENFWTGDFTGDGKTDLLVTPGTYGSGSGWKLFESQDGYFSSNPIAQGPEFDKDTIIYPADFNRDGKMDFIVTSEGTAKLYYSNGRGFEAPITIPGISGKVDVLDVNGDGFPDVLASYIKGCFFRVNVPICQIGWNLYLNNGGSFQLIKAEDGIMAYPKGVNPITGDFNGDGKSDFIIFQHSNTATTNELYFSSGNSIVKASELFPNFSFPPLSNSDICYTGDFNGDGKTDILTVYKKPTTTSNATYNGFRLYLSTGDTFVKVKEAGFPGWGERIIPGDYNGDGRTDLLVTANRDLDVTWGGYRLFLSTGEDFTEVSIPSGWPSRDERIHPGDFNGDGRTDFIVSANKQYIDWGGYKVYLAQVDLNQTLAQSFPTLLGNITNSLGATTEISYTPSSIWPRDVDADGSDRYMPMVLQTVSKIVQRDNMPENSHATTSIYAYEGGLYDPVNREFRGYGKATATDLSSGVYTDTFYHQDRRYQGRIASSTSYDKNDQRSIHTQNTWAAIEYEADTGQDTRVFTYVRQSTVTKYDTDASAMATIQTTYDYDKYGNLKTEDKTITNLKTQPREISRRFTRSVYANDPGRWILGKPTNIRIDDSDPGTSGTYALRETRMTYHPDQPWLLASKTMVTWQADQNGIEHEVPSTTTYGYDAYGNNTLVTNPCNPSWTLETDYSESDGMFPNWVTNAKNQTIRRTFDAAFGVVLTETDPNNQTTTTQYDQFGRPSHVTYPDTSFKHYEYFIQAGQHHVTVTSSQLPETTVWYDNLDREFLKTATAGGKTVNTRTLYNGQGQVWKQSLPYYDGGAIYDTVFRYDDRGRLWKQTNPDATYRTVAYEGFDEIVTDEENHQKRMTKDALGRLVKVQEPTGGVTSYSYDLFDNLISVVDPLGALTTITYDELGRKTFMSDPYMGEWEYRYDVAGNLVYQKDGEGREVEMTYDELNRLASKTYLTTGKIIDYDYDEARTGYYNIGRMTTLTATEPGSLYNTIATNYDRMGRSRNTTQTIDGVPYVTSQTYDLAGRVKTITYPSNSAQVENTYYPMGWLQRVELTETGGTKYPVVQYSDDYTATGQIGTVTYGNGAITTHDYWPGNSRLKNLRTRAYDQNNAWGDIQNIEYQFYDRGNIESITDSVHSATHSFTYDSVNRLETATVACASDPSRAYSQAFTYDLSGNMTSKSGPGGFDVISWQDSTKHIRPKSIVYANQTTGVGQRNITYDQDNMPTHMVFNGAPSYLFYDGTGNRVKKVSGGQTTVYVGSLLEKRGPEITVHIFAGSQRVASIKAGQKFFTHGDHLGSTSLVTNGSGRLVEEIGYLPFGATLFRNAYQGGAWTSVYRFTGQEYDAEFALYNYNARLYDPVTCRFITADTVVPDWTNPQSLNRYAYCMNNPLKYVDPSGNFFWVPFAIAILKAAAIGAAMGAVMGGIMAAATGNNIMQGVLQGAVSGAVSGAFFGAAGYAISAAGIGSQAAQAAIHVTAGSLSGVVNASIAGGDAGKAAIVGGLSAGMAKGLGEGALSKITTGAVVGGVAEELSGGDFAQGAFQGAWMTAAAVSMRAAYNKIVRYDTTWEKGAPAQRKGKLQYPRAGINNIGVQGGDPNAPKEWYSGDEGSLISRAANCIPGVNAVSGLHDVMQIELENNWGSTARNYLNVPGMPIAAAITYGALMTDPMATFIYYTSPTGYR